MPLPANCPTVAVMDVAENIRAKIYAVLGKLGKKLLVRFTGASLSCQVCKLILLWSLFFKDDEHKSLCTDTCARHCYPSVQAAPDPVNQGVWDPHAVF